MVVAAGVAEAVVAAEEDELETEVVVVVEPATTLGTSVTAGGAAEDPVGGTGVDQRSGTSTVTRTTTTTYRFRTTIPNSWSSPHHRQCRLQSTIAPLALGTPARPQGASPDRATESSGHAAPTSKGAHSTLLMTSSAGSAETVSGRTA